MKTTLTFVLCVACVLLAGCAKPDPRDARLALLEKQMAFLQEGQAEMRTNYLELCDLSMRSAESTRTNLLKIQEVVLNYVAKQEALFSALTNFSPTSTPAKTVAASRPVATLYRDGIPASIYAQIAADAAKDYPGSFTVQEYTIRSEVEAYKKLHR